ncbi:hypothetical protein [Burkholderia anthina]|uniref:hypothetical protein n=1 Tax=Burkholderia anthina TaxID=179879 RepID=UPI0012D95098|nr:hypothetical protein [Burkholderia anthina]
MSWMLLRERRFTSNAADLLLICAVAIGDLEARPMTAFKLAQYIWHAAPYSRAQAGENGACGAGGT